MAALSAPNGSFRNDVKASASAFIPPEMPSKKPPNAFCSKPGSWRMLLTKPVRIAPSCFSESAAIDSSLLNSANPVVMLSTAGLSASPTEAATVATSLPSSPKPLSILEASPERKSVACCAKLLSVLPNPSKPDIIPPAALERASMMLPPTARRASLNNDGSALTADSTLPVRSVRAPIPLAIRSPRLDPILEIPSATAATAPPSAFPRPPRALSKLSVDLDTMPVKARVRFSTANLRAESIASCKPRSSGDKTSPTRAGTLPSVSRSDLTPLEKASARPDRRFDIPPIAPWRAEKPEPMAEATPDSKERIEEIGLCRVETMLDTAPPIMLLTASLREPIAPRTLLMELASDSKNALMLDTIAPGRLAKALMTLLTTSPMLRRLDITSSTERERADSAGEMKLSHRFLIKVDMLLAIQLENDFSWSLSHLLSWPIGSVMPNIDWASASRSIAAMLTLSSGRGTS